MEEYTSDNQGKFLIDNQERYLVKKNKHENIKNVFDLKDLNNKFRSAVNSIPGLSYKSKYRGITRHSAWNKKYSNLVAVLLILASVLVLIFMNNKQKAPVDNLVQINKSISKPKAVDANYVEVIYKVKKGDSLWLIANKNNLSVKEILEANPGLNEKIKEGQEIILPKEK
jgi:LysM repeat protein